MKNEIDKLMEVLEEMHDKNRVIYKYKGTIDVLWAIVSIVSSILVILVLANPRFYENFVYRCVLYSNSSAIILVVILKIRMFFLKKGFRKIQIKFKKIMRNLKKMI